MNAQDTIAQEKLTDDDIVLRVLSGEKESFAILIKRYNQRLYRVVRSYVSSDDDVRDVMQDAYVKAYQKLDQFKYKSAFSTWLIRIAINEALQLIRNQKQRAIKYGRTESLDSIFELPDTNQMNPEKQAIKTQNRDLIIKAIDQLPEKYKVVFMLHQMEGLSHAEIGDYLELTEGTVKVQLHRARNLLKEELFKRTQDASIFTFGNSQCDEMVTRVMQRLGDT